MSASPSTPPNDPSTATNGRRRCGPTWTGSRTADASRCPSAPSSPRLAWCGPGRSSSHVGGDDDERLAIVDTPGGAAEVTIDGLGDYAVGRCVWFLGDVERVDPPIAAAGRQRLWHWHPTASVDDQR